MKIYILKSFTNGTLSGNEAVDTDVGAFAKKVKANLYCLGERRIEIWENGVFTRKSNPKEFLENLVDYL